MYFSHKKEWNSDTCHKTDEPWKYVKWKSQIKKVVSEWFHLFEVPRIHKFQESKIALLGPTVESRGQGMGSNCLIYTVSGWNDEKVLKMGSANDCMTLWIYLTPTAFELYT